MKCAFKKTATSPLHLVAMVNYLKPQQSAERRPSGLRWAKHFENVVRQETGHLVTVVPHGLKDLRQDLEVLERRGVPLFLIRDDCGQILSVTAPASKGLPEAVLNDRRDPLHAEALRRTEVEKHDRKIQRVGKQMQWEMK